jgi:lipopolysaccharide biosynthesis regulator YciM
LRALVDEPVPQLVHYQCERAQAAMMAKPPDMQLANEALDAADNAVRALNRKGVGQASEARIAMLRANLAKLNQNPERERVYLESVLSTAPEYAGLVASDLLELYRAAGHPAEGLALLRDHYSRHPELDLFNVVFRELRNQAGYTPAWDFAREALRAHPSLLGLDRLLEAELASGDAAPPPGSPQGADLSLLRSLIHKHTQRLDRYACRVCGFQARHFYWQCPGCNSWETYEPRRLEELK